MPTPEPLYIYDPEQAEILKPSDLLRDLDKLSDAELAELVSVAETMANDLNTTVAKLRAVLVSRQQAGTHAPEGEPQSNVEVPANA